MTLYKALIGKPFRFEITEIRFNRSASNKSKNTVVGCLKNVDKRWVCSKIDVSYIISDQGVKRVKLCFQI